MTAILDERGRFFRNPLAVGAPALASSVHMRSRPLGLSSLATAALLMLLAACSGDDTDNAAVDGATQGEAGDDGAATVDGRARDAQGHDVVEHDGKERDDGASERDGEPDATDDTGPSDTGTVNDTGQEDASADTATSDTGPIDSTVTDTGAPDTSLADTGLADTISGDTGPSCDSGTCTVAGSCPSTATACVIATCATGCCGTVNATQGTLCSDSGGSVCDGNGHCVGGKGDACTNGAQCLNGHCFNGVCCTTACGGTCQACISALTGQSNGTCANISAGIAAPAGQCTASPPCGDDGNCAAGGVCEQVSLGTSCGTAACSGAELTPASACDGAGTCVAAAQEACPGALVCESATACKTSCTTSPDCVGANSCVGGFCVPPADAGTTCSDDAQCRSGICGTSGSGHCCTAACSPSGGSCGATDCDGVGACLFPGNAVAPVALQTPGDCQKIVCSGSGGFTPVDDLTDLPISSTACLINPVCAGSPLAPSFTKAPTGTDCSADGNPPNHVCGDTTNGNIAGACVQCNSDLDCPAINDAATPTCNASTGTCQ